MDTPIPAEEATRDFPRLLREVAEGGRSFVVTSGGVPVARIAPCAGEAEGRERAWRAHLARLAAQPAQGIAIDWTRDELYER